MTKKGEYRLYNLIVPIWLIVWFPGPWWLLLIPANYALDRYVLKVCFSKKGLDCKLLLKKFAWRTCLFGFLSDFIGAVLMLGAFLIPSFIGQYLVNSGNEETGTKLLRWNGTYNVWHDPLSFVIALAAVALSALCIYLFNRKMLSKDPGIGAENAEYAAKWLAIATAPYLYLIGLQFGGA